MTYSENGSLIIFATGASGALPIEGAKVVIKGSGEENRFEEYSLFTDMDGVTPPVTLLAPDKINSTEPNPKNDAFSTYDVTVSKEGYYTKKIMNVSVFPTTRSYLPVNMIPVGTLYDIPENNLITIITQDLS